MHQNKMKRFIMIVPGEAMQSVEKMARNVIWTYTAEEDLEAAAFYIHRDSPVYDASFVDRY
jgi:hypothetical protein